ncbi:MAG: ribonuclease HII [Nanoarchaeota archaeon]|nr:ribonuclease HII [Nanoarchaeota archaeon]
MLTLGIDEAAKGPCIGNMYIVGTLFNEKDLDKLKEMGVKDSKLLTHKDRIELGKKIKKIAEKILVIEATPKEIDEAIDGDNNLNLNWFEAHHIADIINKLKPDRAVIDCPSTNLEVFKNYVKNLLENKNVELIVKHKADRDFIECASSSIIAKNKREENVLQIEKKVKESIGSGYPSNPVCQEFLKNNYNKYPDIFRKSWKTYKKVAGQKNLTDF